MSKREREELADDVMRCGQLAAALEVSGWPKPGNVHRAADFASTRFEHFISGSISLGPSVRDGALNGIAVEAGEIGLEEVGVGHLARRAVADMRAWHRGGNTHLGVILLFTPIAITAGITLASSEAFDLMSFRTNFKKVMRSTTPEDAAEVYEAILMANPGGLGRVKGVGAPDLTSREAKQELMAKKLSLHDVMRISSSWDTVAKELATGLKITLGIGYPTLLKTYSETQDINIATVHTYLMLLSRFPDTFVARNVGLRHVSEVREAARVGMNKANEISARAGKVLRMGGLTTVEGRKSLLKFDEDLRKEGEDLSPGTTADLTAASLMVALLCGLRF